MANVQIYPSVAQVAHAAAEHIVVLSTEAINTQGRFSIGLSGGSTPRALFDLLASDTYVSRLDWVHMHVFWGDERCVPPNHADSNYHMARDTLLDFVPVPESQIHRMRGEIDPTQAADEYEATLRTFFAGQTAPRFDLLLLGMGSDGHTASLFPGTAALHETARWVVAHHVPQLDTWRITLTAPAINAAANIMFLVTGANKAEVLAGVLHGDLAPDTYPSLLIRPTSGDLIWMIDETAAELI